jgi:hypothetical protein
MTAVGAHPISVTSSTKDSVVFDLERLVKRHPPRWRPGSAILLPVRQRSRAIPAPTIHCSGVKSGGAPILISGWAKHRAWAGDADVAQQCEVEPAAELGTVDRRDRRLGEPPDGEMVAAGAVADHAREVGLRELLEVEAPQDAVPVPVSTTTRTRSSVAHSSSVSEMVSRMAIESALRRCSLSRRRTAMPSESVSVANITRD